MSNEQNNYSVDSAPKDPKCPGEGACEHVFFLHQQSRYIDDLRSQLSAIMAERDLLLCEVSRLKFELEIADIKRINDDRTETSTKTDTSSTETHQHFNGNVHSEENTSENYTTENSPSNSYGTHNWAQNVNKKGSFRNTNDTLQRSRVQHVYELSQDLLDKQIEMLERKYGGDKARNAALTIQRAFRHYTLVKKFATITSMAKAEKRFSRRLMAFQEEGNDTRFLDCFASNTNLKQNTNLPLRSLSMREKRSLSSPMPTLPRSYSGRCELACYSAANINQQCSTREPCTENKPEESNGVSNKSRTPRIPPEVPKRTSSISIRSLENPAGNASLNKNSDSGSISSVQSSGSESSVIHPVTTIKNINVPETVRKRQYRVGLNLFNKKPERGISYLIKHGFLENSPQHIAQFLITRKKGLSKQMIGEYLGNLQDPFNGAVLEFFAQELDLSGMQVDVALRKFQTYFRMPGEAQKVERIIEVFSHRYCQCNRDMVARLRSIDTVFVLAFAIIMLNTDLHTPNIKADRRMTLDDFIKNLRGVDDCCDIDKNMLIGIYKRVKANEFKTAADHVHQVLKVQSTIVGKIPNLALPHRRLVCYCRLYEVRDIYKKEKDGVHQREVFLFNDLLVITKLLSKKKSSVTYTFRQSFSLSGLAVSLFEVPYYPFGIRLSQRVDNQVLVTFNARNDHDRVKFVEDIRESISEMDEMENLRIEAELEKQKTNRNGRSVSGNCNENRDSGVADVEVCPCIHSESPTHYADTHTNLKRSALSNSLLDIHEQAQCPVAQFSEPPQVYSTSLDQSDSL